MTPSPSDELGLLTEEARLAARNVQMLEGQLAAARGYRDLCVIRLWAEQERQGMPGRSLRALGKVVSLTDMGVLKIMRRHEAAMAGDGDEGATLDSTS
jgi:hypothetical protein